MYKKVLLVFILLFSLNTRIFSQKGKLETGKESLNSTNSYRSNGQKSVNKTDSGSSFSDDDAYMNPFIKTLWYAVAYTVYGVVIESPWEFNAKMHDAEIAHYPYEKAYHGNFIYTDATNYNITRFDVSTNFVRENKRLNGVNFGVNFHFFRRFALDLEYLHLSENVNNKTDSFSLYSALLRYYRIRTQRFDAWFGLGVMHVANNVDKTGFGLGVGAQWFVAKPISLNFTHKWTNINRREVHKTKLELKYHLKKYHISSGYEHFKIGVSKINAFSIGVGASF